MCEPPQQPGCRIKSARVARIATNSPRYSDFPPMRLHKVTAPGAEGFCNPKTWGAGLSVQPGCCSGMTRNRDVSLTITLSACRRLTTRNTDILNAGFSADRAIHQTTLESVSLRHSVHIFFGMIVWPLQSSGLPLAEASALVGLDFWGGTVANQPRRKGILGR